MVVVAATGVVGSDAVFVQKICDSVKVLRGPVQTCKRSANRVVHGMP